MNRNSKSCDLLKIKRLLKYNTGQNIYLQLYIRTELIIAATFLNQKYVIPTYLQIHSNPNSIESGKETNYILGVCNYWTREYFEKFHEISSQNGFKLISHHPVSFQAPSYPDV